MFLFSEKNCENESLIAKLLHGKETEVFRI